MIPSPHSRVAALPGEPTPESLSNPIARLLVATKPGFLTITLFGTLLGLATAWVGAVPFSAWLAGVTIFLAVSTHAAVNVLNDWCDHLNGTDAINDGRIYPFTGGSRLIQNGVVTPGATRALAIALFAFSIAGGVLLTFRVGPQLLWFGVAGVVIGWAYSARPLALNCRGLGELCVASAFWLLVAGADFVQRGAISAVPFWAGAGYALMVTNILYINQFPDRVADAAVGKRHWVVRMDVRTARWGYPAIVVLAALSIITPVVIGALPAGALLALVGLLPAMPAAKTVVTKADTPRELLPAIKQTILSAHLVALLMGIGLVVQHAMQG
jgi:1,4-dihydroxy-2-naphthoate octaprenyltransferase